MSVIITLFLIQGMTGKIQGIVMDENTGEPIPYADIIISETEIGTAADGSGNFFILNVPPGIYTVEFSCIGYQTQQIEFVQVNIDQTVRLEVSLRESPIEIEPVTVVHRPPALEKDWTGTTYIIRKEEIETMPIDYMMYMIQFQASVARPDTSLHVRGGRATEVNYLIDNVSIIDPLTGDPAINVSKGIIDEVVFLPGGFDAEYGRAMSGVINLVTERPKDKFHTNVYGKSERIMPYYYDFGYENYQSSVHVPVSKKFRQLYSLDLIHTDDWIPKLHKLPHRQRDDYFLYGKWLFAPSGKLRMSLSGAKSRSQYDTYFIKWLFNMDNYRSDLRKGDLQAFTLNYLPDSRKLITVTVSRLYTKSVYGVREIRDCGPFEDFSFRDIYSLQWWFGSINNPFGVRRAYFPVEGDFPEYRNRTSEVYKANMSTNLQMHKYHEIKAGIEYAYHEFDNFTYWISNDTTNPITDEWQYNPVEYSVFVQDNIDYEGLYAKLGCRYDYFSSDIEGVSPKAVISPRLGVSFLVTEKFLFRANVGRYTQPPLYDYMYSYYKYLPYPTYIWPILTAVPIGNPELCPEQTISYEIGLQGEIRQNLSVTINAFYKDISDLIGTRLISYEALKYTQYFNVEYANVRGTEAIVEFANSLFTGKVSYTLSWARGTSSYAREVHDLYWRDTTYVPPSEDYYLDFDQRHRIFLQGTLRLPLQARLYLFGYLGHGFPYTPPGPEGKITERNILRLSFRRQIDCIISKPVRMGNLMCTINLEIINLLDARYQVRPYGSYLATAVPWEYDDFISVRQPYYHPAADLNHDGLITPYEEFQAQTALAEATNEYVWADCYTSPRRARIGINVSF